jgi:NAD(P)H-hydrate epimerase
MRSAIDALDAAPVPVLAVDAPSGLDGSTGRIHGAAAKADLTVTFGFPKPGLFLGEGPETVGRIVVVPLGYPPVALAAAGRDPLEWIVLGDAEAALPRRRHDAHKGSAGRILVVAGSEAFRGAALLTAAAALRSGAGLCVLAAPPPVGALVLEALPEAIVVALPTKGKTVTARAAKLVAEAAREADAIALGPGLSQGEGVEDLVEAALDAAVPAVVDADALNVLARDPAPIRRAAPTVLTPHPAELGRWLGRSAAAVDAERLACAGEAAARWGAHVVLKGSPTVVAEPGGRSALNLTGNPGLAVAGSGDVLTGLLGALIAQGMAADRAARAAVFLHGLAADWAARDLGERGMTSSDLFRYLPITMREVAAGRGVELLEQLDHRHAALLGAGPG